MKKTTRTPRPAPLWIFAKPLPHPNSLAFSLHCVTQQLEWVMRRLTPEMEKVLVRRRQKPEYVCQFCGEKFAKGCALGGHMSKRHSNKRNEEMRSQQLEQNSSTMMPNHPADSTFPQEHTLTPSESALETQMASLQIGATCPPPSFDASQ
jgi:hypothetical protein